MPTGTGSERGTRAECGHVKAGVSALRLSAVDIRNVRILAQAALEPSEINVLFGPNGSGKTSVLEAIHYLCTGRTFAGGRVEALVRTGAERLRVVGRGMDARGRMHRFGVEQGRRGGRHMRLDGRTVDRIAEIAVYLPVVALHPGSHEILAGGPSERRRLLDWGLFHVEQGYLAQWQRYRRVLVQRNASLQRRRSDSEVAIWEPELGAAAEAIDRSRRAYVEGLQAEINRVGPTLLREGEGIELAYRPGWPEGTALSDVLRERRSADRERGWTGVGAHRADLILRLDGKDTRNRVSRGQQKLLVYLLRLAQLHDLVAKGGRPMLLLDDLSAELDADHRERVMAEAVATGGQVFVTALEPDRVPVAADCSPAWFHVEQGQVREVVQ